MKSIVIYTTETCPKCRALKVFLKTIGVNFAVKDMAKNMPYLSAYNGWPQDNTAPIMELVSLDGRKDPIFYDHYALFDRDGLKKGYVKKILGIEGEE